MLLPHTLPHILVPFLFCFFEVGSIRHSIDFSQLLGCEDETTQPLSSQLLDECFSDSMTPYFDLNTDQFEQIVVAIGQHLFGAGLMGFASGKDAGRDAKFIGTAQEYPSRASPWRVAPSSKPNILHQLGLHSAMLMYLGPVRQQGSSWMKLRRLVHCISQERRRIISLFPIAASRRSHIRDLPNLSALKQAYPLRMLPWLAQSRSTIGWDFFHTPSLLFRLTCSP